jgi:hypothetical protein
MCRSKGTDEGYFVFRTMVLNQFARKYFRPIEWQPSHIYSGSGAVAEAWV